MSVGDCARGAMNPFCASLDERTRLAMCKGSHPIDLAKGGVLSVSSIPNDAVILCRGVMVNQAVGDSPKGSMSFVGISGDIGNIQRIAAIPEGRDVYFNEGDCGLALTACSLCAVPLSVMRGLFVADSRFALEVFSRLSDRYASTLDRLVGRCGLSVEERLRGLLDELDEQGVDTSTVTHEQLAWALGVNRVTVTKLMKKI